MASGHVLRFPRSDKEGAFVIVHVTPTRSKALDVKLVGTDGVEPYAVSCELHARHPALPGRRSPRPGWVGLGRRCFMRRTRSLPVANSRANKLFSAVRHDKVVSLRVKSSPCSDEEWVSVLTAVIRQEPLDDVEVVASVEDESSVTLTVRKKGKEFTQRLGAIELSHSPRELIELYDWCGLSAQTAGDAKEALAAATAKASKLEESVRELKAHLDELIAAKEAHEAELLEKFRDLLNEKKVKIRQQQKLLASAAPGKPAAPSVKEDPTQEQTSRGSGARRAAGKSRPTKRKVAPPPVQEDESASEEFERMDLDANAKRPAELSDQEQNTTEDDDATASEDEDEEPAAVPPVKRAPSKQPAPVKETPKPAAKDVPPPKRELPFARKKQAAAKAPPPPVDSETESDDEL
ncbi:mitotic apparatus protein p62-like protein [Colletotrichum chrysophilum]|uniref:Mitotic apparatus protein p62-like protein n=1 Tax=Colletotrichum chrysophilum TaxID=1836956 RepID=A0AAD9AHN6_9PEZI|nr:mitotic apparatus protein p62-like protein [Colletotrichum chrysophilum]